jgi:hypothetical protein
VLRYHTGPSAIAKVNRLWDKHPSSTKPNPLPTLTESDLDVVAEEWQVEDLWAIVHEKQRTHEKPKQDTGAVVVLCWNGSKYLLDGRRRINHWWREKFAGPHRVLVLSHAGKRAPLS